MALVGRYNWRLVAGILFGYLIMTLSFLIGLWATFASAVTGSWSSATTPEDIRLEALLDGIMRVTPWTFILGIVLIGVFSTAHERWKRDARPAGDST